MCQTSERIARGRKTKRRRTNFGFALFITLEVHWDIQMTLLFTLVFWISVGTLLYTFGGYAVLMTLLARWRNHPVRVAPITPSVSLIIPAYNEQAVIAEKLGNTFALDYPRELLEIIVVTDGSDDRTPEIVRAYAARGVRLLHQPERRGKIAAMNRAVPYASGEVLVFSDANAMIEPQAIRALVANFADPQVACVGGVKRIRVSASVQARGESAYWRYEAYLKKLDSQVNTAIGAIGELFAIRRELYRPLAEDLIIEDFVMTMELVAQGWRVVYEPTAATWEDASPSLRGEWRRRSRNAAGGFKAMGRLKEMMNPLRSFAAFQFFSHKVLRWLAPFFMLGAFFANLGLLHSPIYRVLFTLQVIFYALALLRWVMQIVNIHLWLLQVPFYFCFANATSLGGFYKFITGTQPATWVKAR
jgi:cellulose synthase/poly-beta-1,6-N-acetylglucosamine synthase-like glycosyltransferase